MTTPDPERVRELAAELRQWPCADIASRIADARVVGWEVPTGKDHRALRNGLPSLLAAAEAWLDAQTQQEWLRREAERYQTIAAEQGNRIFRAMLAVRLARAWGIQRAGWDGETARLLADWIDAAAGDVEPLPWPQSPFVQQWLRDKGYDDINGKIGFRLRGELTDDARAALGEQEGS